MLACKQRWDDGPVQNAYPETSFSRGTVTHGSGASILVRHDRLHPAIGVFDGLRAIRVGNELGLACARDAVRMLEIGGRGAADGGSVCGNVPLRGSGRQLHVIVLFAFGVPLCDPSRREMGWCLGRALAARRAWTRHVMEMSYVVWVRWIAAEGGD